MKNLIVVGHNDFSNSTASKLIIENLKDMPDTEIRILSELYPSLDVNTKTEQDILLRSQNIVFQFPMHWYSVPYILKLWIDKTFLPGFAYGVGGDKLRDKNVFLSLTTSGTSDSYSKEGHNEHTISEFLFPLEISFKRAHMVYDKKPIVSYAIVSPLCSYEKIKELSKIQADKIRDRLK